jgi:hypothetical protein
MVDDGVPRDAVDPGPKLRLVVEITSPLVDPKQYFLEDIIHVLRREADYDLAFRRALNVLEPS